MNEPKADHVVMICRCIEDGEMRQVEVPSPPDHLADISASLRSISVSNMVTASTILGYGHNAQIMTTETFDAIIVELKQVKLSPLNATSPPTKA